MESKGIAAQIRALSRSGLSPREIIARGYKRSSVYDSLRRGRKRQGERAMLEEILTVSLEMIRLLRELRGEAAGVIDHLSR